MDVFRLDSIAAVVANHFRQASSSKRRQAALVACEHAATTVGLTAREAGEALAVLRGAAAPDRLLRQQLERLAAELDDEYFRLSEDGDPARKHESLQLFSKARATFALAFALSEDDAHLHEAIYEAIVAMDDPSDLTYLVDAVLV